LLDPDAPTAGDHGRPRVFYGWYIVAASVATNALFSAAYFQGFSALFLPIESYFGWNRTVISAAMSLRQLESGIASPLVGFLLDRMTARRMILISAWISAIGLIGLGLITGIKTFYLFFVIVSLGSSGVSHVVTWPVLISRWFRRKRGLAMGLAVLGPIFGSPFVIVNTSLEETIGWRTVLIGYGLIVLIGISLLGLLARERPESYGLLPDGDLPEAGETVATAAARSRAIEAGLPLREVLRTKEFWLLTSFLGGVFMVNSAIQVHQIPYFVNDRGMSGVGAAVTLTLVFVISGVGRIGGGYLLDKMDYRILLMAMAGIMGLSLVYLQIAPVHSVLTTLPFVALFGVGLGTMIPLRGALGSMMFGLRSLGSVIGLLQGGAVGAGVVGPIFMGIVFDLNGDYSVGIWVLAAVSFAMMPMALLMSAPDYLRQRTAAAVEREER
jgi:MFS family permease